MGHLQKRGTDRWAARYIDADGRERLKSFRRKTDAQDFLKTVEVDVLRGVYVDPQAGRITLAAYVEDWLTRQTSDPSTRVATELRFRVHILPGLGRQPLAAIKPSMVQAWIGGLERQQVAPTYIRVLLANLSSVLTAAVDDERILRNPCAASSVRAPKLETRKV